ncbi:MAG TPA: FHA domain-containing protein [bacterium]|nr:FHA domain-containing protein [bacterium]
MRDGMTRRKRIPSQDPPTDRPLANLRPSLVLLTGSAAGHEIALQADRTLLGRGPGVDVAIADETMSRQHFAVEVSERSYRLRDLGSTNGVLLNGKRVESADLKHGDRLKAGDHEFQFLLEKIDEPRTYVVPD